MVHAIGDPGFVAWTNAIDGQMTTKIANTDGRLTDARTPTAHQHPLTDLPAVQAALNAKLDANSIGAVNPGLATWRKARNAMATAPAKILCVGDSITEGAYSNSVTARWTSVLASLIAARYSVPTSTLGYLTASSNSVSTVQPLTVTNGATQVNWGVSCGASTLLTASTGKITGTVTGTAIDIMYLRTTGTGTFTVKVDNVQVGGAYGGTAGAITDGYVQRVAMGAAGSHTIEIDAGAASVYIEGINVLNGNEASGVQVFNAGYSGAVATRFSAPNGVPWWQQAINGIAPHLIIIMLNANDYAGATTMANYQLQIDTIVANIRTGIFGTNPMPSILFVSPARISYPSTAQWGAYVHVLRTSAKRDGSAEFLDLAQYMPDLGSAAGDASGYYTIGEQTHPNPAGHARMAALLDLCLADKPVV